MPAKTKFVCGAITLFLCTVSASTFAGPVRRWTDASGKRHIEAELVNVEGDKAQFRRTDNGVVVNIAIQSLSAEDSRFIQHWSDPAKRPALEKFVEIGDVGCHADGSIYLGLSQSGCTNNDLKLAATLPEVVSIYLFECPVSDEGLAALASLKRLRRLTLEDLDVKGPGFKYLAGLTNLEEFSYYTHDTGIDISPYMQHLGGLKKLKRLAIRYSGVGATGLKVIGQLRNLEELELYDCGIESPALESISRLTKLRVLELASNAIEDDDLAHLAGMSELRTLGLKGGSISRVGMQHIAQLKKLERLELPGSLTDEDLAPLASMTQLKNLQLAGELITDAGLAHVAPLVNLEQLTLPEKITVAGLPHLEKLTKLKNLQILGESITFTQLMELFVDRQKRSVTEAMQTILESDIVEDGEVRWLSLDFRPRADLTSLKYVAQLPKLKSLSLGKETTDAWLAELKPLESLTNLQLRGERYDDQMIELSAEGLKHLAALPNLKSIDLSDCVIKGDAFTELARLPQLDDLRLMECQVSDASKAALGKLQNLEYLFLYGTNLDDADMDQVAKLTKLTTLCLPNDVTVQGIAKLKPLKNLTSLQANFSSMSYYELMTMLTDDWGLARDDALDLFMTVEKNSDGKITSLHWAYDMTATEGDLALLAELTELESLEMPKGVTDDALAHIAGLKKLRSLSLEDGLITDSGLVHLAGLKELEDLSLNAASITDAGLDHLVGLAKLRQIRLYNSQVTDAGLAKLQKAIPKASIAK